MKCDHGKMMQLTIQIIKDTQERLRTATDTWLKEENRDQLNSNKKWLKHLDREHREFCLGEAHLIIEDLMMARKEKVEKWQIDHSEFMKLYMEYENLRSRLI